MNEQEMKARIKEIDKMRDELAREKRKYEDKLYNKEKENIFEAHKEFEGKCFKTLGLTQNQTRHIKAFKILKVLEPHHHDYAECLVIVDGIERNCWNVQAIKIETLPVWCSNTNSMLSKPSDPKMIDMYELIEEDEFMDIYKNYMNKFINLVEAGGI